MQPSTRRGGGAKNCAGIQPKSERILVDGAHRAREIAAPIMAQVRLATGIR